jgi:hypothetical protein
VIPSGLDAAIVLAVEAFALDEATATHMPLPKATEDHSAATGIVRLFQLMPSTLVAHTVEVALLYAPETITNRPFANVTAVHDRELGKTRSTHVTASVLVYTSVLRVPPPPDATHIPLP